MSKIWPICSSRLRIAVSVLLASLALPCRADPAPVIHYAPPATLPTSSSHFFESLGDELIDALPRLRGPLGDPAMQFRGDAQRERP